MVVVRLTRVPFVVRSLNVVQGDAHEGVLNVCSMGLANSGIEKRAKPRNERESRMTSSSTKEKFECSLPTVPVSTRSC